MPALSKKDLYRLYVTKSRSVAEISRFLACSQSRVNYWLHRYGIPKRSISDALYRAHNPDGDPFDVRKVTTLSQAVLFGMGLGLYWGEGNKRNPNTIRLGNTDPFLISQFVLFLRDTLGVPIQKLRFGLQIFSDMNPKTAKNFWMKSLSRFQISSGQFQRIIITKARSIGTYREKTQWGVLTVYCSNIKLKRILDEMLAKYRV